MSNTSVWCLLQRAARRNSPRRRSARSSALGGDAARASAGPDRVGSDNFRTGPVSDRLTPGPRPLSALSDLGITRWQSPDYLFFIPILDEHYSIFLKTFLKSIINYFFINDHNERKLKSLLWQRVYTIYLNRWIKRRCSTDADFHVKELILTNKEFPNIYKSSFNLKRMTDHTKPRRTNHDKLFTQCFQLINLIVIKCRTEQFTNYVNAWW